MNSSNIVESIVEQQAPLELGAVVVKPYDYRFVFKIHGGSMNFTLESMMMADLDGAGVFHLHDLHVVYTFPENSKGGEITVAFDHVEASRDITMIQHNLGSLHAYSNSFTNGQRHEVRLGVPGMFSRQLFPHSADHPRFKVMVKAVSVDATLIADIRVPDARTLYRDLKV
jgi:hypothetical protein